MSLLPPPPPDDYRISSSQSSSSSSSSHKKNEELGCQWQYVEVKSSLEKDKIPCQRSLHSGAIWRDNLLIFGGYDGHKRINDLWSYNFTTCRWTLLNDVDAPSPRDRHVAVVTNDDLFIFGGFGKIILDNIYTYICYIC